MPTLPRVALAASALLGVALAVPPVVVRQQEFVVEASGSRFMMIGVDYQPGGQAGYKPQEGEDVLTNGDVCLRDAAIMQGLGVNTVRVYNIDPRLDHDLCASIFNAAGIYLLMDVNSPFGGESINRADPASSYNAGYLTRVFSVVEAFKNYPNTLGFFAANEVMNDLDTISENPQYIRAVQRDLKQYIANHSPRTIPVGYSAADVREILTDTWNYMQCAIEGEEGDVSRSDFFGLNSYSWCGDANFDNSGYDDIVATFGSTTIPVFFSEYGCNELRPAARLFTEVGEIYGPRMSGLSGGLVYEYSEEEADYGLVIINSNGTVSLREDFDNLQQEYNRVNLTQVESVNATATNLDAPRCEASLITWDGFSTEFNLPEQPSEIADLIRDGVSNAREGNLVEVTETRPSQEVYGTNGGVVENIELRILADDQSNLPNGQSTTGAGNGGGGNGGGDDQGAASGLKASAFAAVCAAGLALMLL